MEDKIEKGSGGQTMWVSECCVKQHREFPRGPVVRTPGYIAKSEHKPHSMAKKEKAPKLTDHWKSRLEESLNNQ